MAYAHSLGPQRAVPHYVHIPVPGHPVCPLLEALRAGLAFVTSPGTTFWQTFREEGQREKRGDAGKVS